MHYKLFMYKKEEICKENPREHNLIGKNADTKMITIIFTFTINTI